MNFDNLTEQMKEIAGFLLGLMLITKWFESKTIHKDPTINKLAQEDDNYLSLGEWG